MAGPGKPGRPKIYKDSYTKIVNGLPMVIHPPNADRRKRSKHPLGKPYRVVEYNGLQIPLYQSRALLAIIGIGSEPLREHEKAGRVPRPMFVINRLKYYSIWELRALLDLILLWGRPKISEKTHPGFIKEWKEKWAAIRQSIIEGVVPDIPIYLHYPSREELRADIQEMCYSLGLHNQQTVDKMVAFLQRKSMT